METCCIYLGSRPYKEDYEVTRISHKVCQGHLPSPLARFSSVSTLKIFRVVSSNELHAKIVFFFSKISLFHSRKIQFLKGVTPRFLVKKGRFLLSLFLGQISLNCLFLDILDGKEGFKDYKIVFFFPK